MMMQKDKNITPYAILIFIVGLMIRFVRLSAQPLTVQEASLAWQAFEIVNGGMVGSTAVVAPLSFASIAFFLTQANEFNARLWSVLVGSVIVLLPWLWKKELGEKACLIISLAFAIDPLISASTRVLGSPMFALATILSAFSLLKNRKYIAGGIVLALAFLSGASFWWGSLLIGIAWLLTYMLNRTFKKPDEALSTPKIQKWIEKGSLFKILAAAAATIGIVGSYFFLNSAGLSSLGAGIIEFLQKLTNPSGVGIWQIFVGLLVYSLFPLVMGVISAWHSLARKDVRSIFLVVWAALALILLLLLPGREVFDLIWVLVPLYILTGKYLVGVIVWTGERLWLRLFVMLLSLVIFIFVGLNIRSFSINMNASDQVLGLVISLLAGPILLTLSVLLIGIGWDIQHALQGLLYGVLILGVALSVSSSLSWVMGRSGSKAELWQTSALLDASQTLQETISDASGAIYGKPYSAKIIVIGEDSQMLNWALRRFEHVDINPFWSDGMQADIILTSQTLGEGVGAEYRGTEVSLLNRPEWKLLPLKEVLRWTQTKAINFTHDKYYLWVKTDLLPTGWN